MLYNFKIQIQLIKLGLKSLKLSKDTQDNAKERLLDEWFLYNLDVNAFICEVSIFLGSMLNVARLVHGFDLECDHRFIYFVQSLICRCVK